MTDGKKSTRDVLVFLLATVIVIGIAGGAVLWNARGIEKRREPERKANLQTQSIETVDIRLSYGNGSQFSSAGMMPGSEKMSWWRPIGSQSIYLASLFGPKPTITRISTSTGIGSRIATLGNHQYDDAHSSNENEIYLLRIDSSNGRFRLVGDIYSVADGRILGKRTLLHSHRLAGYQTTTLWNPNGSTLAVTTGQFNYANKQTPRTHIIELQTGTPITFANGSTFLDHQRAIAFSRDGRRLILIEEKLEVDSEPAKTGRSVVVVDQQTGKQSSTAISGFPSMIPLAISDDAKWVAYASNQEVQLWNTQTGEKTTTLRARSDGHPPGERLKVKFLADGELIGVADVRTVSVYETETGIRISRYPDVPPNEQLEVTPLYLDRHHSELIFVGSSLVRQDSKFVPGTWMHRMTISQDLSAVQSTRSVVAEGASQGSTNTVSWTDWMSFADYDDEFKRQTKKQKYPITVVGRNDNGTSQFRAQFVHRPSDLDFFSHHNMTTVVPRPPLVRYYSKGYHDVWTQWFVDQEGTTRYNTVWTKRLDYPTSGTMGADRRPGDERRKREQAN